MYGRFTLYLEAYTLCSIILNQPFKNGTYYCTYCTVHVTNDSTKPQYSRNRRNLLKLEGDVKHVDTSTRFQTYMYGVRYSAYIHVGCCMLQCCNSLPFFGCLKQASWTFRQCQREVLVLPKVLKKMTCLNTLGLATYNSS